MEIQGKSSSETPYKHEGNFKTIYKLLAQYVQEVMNLKVLSSEMDQAEIRLIR